MGRREERRCRYWRRLMEECVELGEEVGEDAVEVECWKGKERAYWMHWLVGIPVSYRSPPHPPQFILGR